MDAANIRKLYHLALMVIVSAFILTGFSFFYMPPAPQKKFYCGVTSEMMGVHEIVPPHGNNATGKDLFEKNCKQCHALDKVVVGPPLSGITERREKAWIYDFIHNSQDVIKSGDSYAVALFDKFSGTVMPPFPNLSENDIDSLLEYIEPGQE